MTTDRNRTQRILSVSLLALIIVLTMVGTALFVIIHNMRLELPILLSASVVAIIAIGVEIYYSLMIAPNSTLTSVTNENTKPLNSPMTSKQLKKLRDEIQNAENISRVKDLYKKLIAKLKVDKTTLTYELWTSLAQESGYLDKAQQADLATRRTKVHNLISDILKQLPPEQTEALSHPGLNLPSFESASTSRSASDSSPAPLGNKFEVSRPNDLQIEVDRLQRENTTLLSRISTLTTAGKQAVHDASASQSLSDSVTLLNRRVQEQWSQLASEKARAQELEETLRRKEAQDAERDHELQQAKSDLEKANQQASAERRERLPFIEYESALDYLRKHDETTIGHLAEFTNKLVQSADAISGPVKAAAASKNITELKANLEHLDRVYEEFPAVARNANHREASLKTVQAIAVVQEHLHRELGNCKIELIDPDHLEPFDAKWYIAGEGGHKEWTTDREQDNLIHSVLKIGFKYRDQVLRQAVIRRYVYLRNDAATANPVEEIAPERVEEIESSKQQASPALLPEPPQDSAEARGASEQMDEQSSERDAVMQTAIQIAAPHVENESTSLDAPALSEIETSNLVPLETEDQSIDMGEHPVQTPEAAAIVVDLQEQKMPYAPGISTESSDLPEATIEVSPETPDEIAPEPVASTERKSGLDLMRDLLETNSKT